MQYPDFAFFFPLALSQIDVQMEVISPIWVLIYVTSVSRDIKSCGTNHFSKNICNSPLFFSAQSHEEKNSPDTEDACMEDCCRFSCTCWRFPVLQLVLWMDIQPSSSKNPRSGTWEPCKSGSSEHQKHETSFEHWSE